jgi:hypothetical protein
MTKIVKGELDGTKGRWKGTQATDDFGVPVHTALVSCPLCGKIGSLSRHEIDREGRVTPQRRMPEGR